jgi:hypothetical protein
MILDDFGIFCACPEMRVGLVVQFWPHSMGKWWSTREWNLSLSRTSRWNVVSYFLPNPLAQLTLFGCRVWVFLPWSKTVVLEYVCKLYPLSLLRNMSILILFVSELGAKSLFWRVTIHQPEIKPRWDSYPYPPCCPTFLWCHSEVVTSDPHF